MTGVGRLPRLRVSGLHSSHVLSAQSALRLDRVLVVPDLSEALESVASLRVRRMMLQGSARDRFEDALRRAADAVRAAGSPDLARTRRAEALDKISKALPAVSGEIPALRLEAGQAALLVESLDRFVLFGLGRLVFAEHSAIRAALGMSCNRDASDALDRAVAEMKALLLPELAPGACWGIGNRADAGWEPHAAFDLQQVVRHALSWRLHREGGGTGPTWTVDFDPPLRYGEAPLPRAAFEDEGS